MGALFDIGQGADAEIKQKLNDAFSGTKLQKLQKHWDKKEKLFDDHHRLERFCARAKLHPTKNYGKDDAKGKWYWLLDSLKKVTDGSVDGAGNPVTTANAIKSALTTALNFNANGITRVVFDAQEQSGAPAHFIYPHNNAPGLIVGTTLNIVLVCPAPLSDNNVENPPTDPDNGEKPLPFAKRPGKGKGGKKKAKKTKAGKKKS
jgi:hypothetical protein